MLRRHTNELGDILVKSVFDRLQRDIGKGNIIPLCMIVNIDSISGLEGAKRHTFFVCYEQTMFFYKIHELVAYCTQGEKFG
jgi:hypothetical protein